MQTVGDLAHVVARLADGQRPLLADQLFQVRPIHVFQYQEVAAPDLIGVVGGDDVGMDELGGGADLAQEQLLGAAGADQVGRQHLEGDDPAHGAVFGLENAAHAAAADLFEDAVLPQQKAGGAADQQALGLEPGQQPLLDQEAGDGAAAVGRWQLLFGAGQLLLREQAALAHVGQKRPAVNLLRCCHDDRLEWERRPSHIIAAGGQPRPG